MCCSLTAAAMQRFKRGLLSVGLILFGLQINVALAANLQLDKLRLPPGFHIEVLTDAVPNARQMALAGMLTGAAYFTWAAWVPATSTQLNWIRGGPRRYTPLHQACRCR